jgi:hypothetical protein
LLHISRFLSFHLRQKKGSIAPPFSFPIPCLLEAKLDKWLVWKDRLTFILPVAGGLTAAAVGIRMLILTNFSNSGWEFMGRCGADALGFFLVAGICWLKKHPELGSED